MSKPRTERWTDLQNTFRPDSVFRSKPVLLFKWVGGRASPLQEHSEIIYNSLGVVCSDYISEEQIFEIHSSVQTPWITNEERYLHWVAQQR